MRKFFAAIAAASLALLVSMPAGAADLPLKAPDWNSVFKGYPYGSSGLFFGIYTEGGGGSVTGTVPGVGAASLTTTQAGVGGTIGYAWGQKGSPVAFSAEADFGWTNFNGATAGLGLTGPASFEQRFVMFTPLATIISLLPNFPALGTVAPFPTLPAGVTASNLQVGLMAGIDENDISPNFPGIAANREWRVAPMIGLVSMEQLSNGLAVRSWVKTVLPERGVCAGPIANACINMGPQVKAGVGFYF